MKDKLNIKSSIAHKDNVLPPGQRNLFLIVSFVEGAAVMIIELLGAKIVAPFYGTSMYVWASVLGVTLIALSSGYFIGGSVSNKYKDKSPLFVVLAVGAILTIIAPRIAPTIMMATTDFGVRIGSLISVSIYLLPPIFCMGMVSPIIIQLINQSQENAGQTAGTIYAISTVGGILATFLAGFVLIPELGIQTTATFTGLVLIIISAIGMLSRKQKTQAALTFGLFVLFVPFVYSKPTSDPAITIQYQSSGILGEWTVVDHKGFARDGRQVNTRQLLLNGVDQTFTNVGIQPFSVWRYPHKVTALAGIKPAKSKALLLGMGGGSIAYNLIKLGFELDIVELDERIPFIAEQWFGYDPTSSNLIIDDARHYIRNTAQKYDVVILDIVNGEVQPSHMFTQEGLKELKTALNDDALVIVNFQGQLDTDDPTLSRAPRSVIKTFESIGYKMFAVRNESKSISADLLIYGTPGTLNIKEALSQNLRYNELLSNDHFSAADYAPITGYELGDVDVLTDDKPNLELLNTPTVLNWRKNKIEYTVNGLIKKGVPIY
ncbi:spermidine synthase [Runella salmonicolor]|uniref:Fused MFS/spermidine synthase n=1 Tax=Runella salmonicolor TaxID=2950278 RepID=A0ABT1FVI3_9BACT|nr:fused MFS/spermidine synthase [Runella salmonicolor]MCP1385778.1 fused MFS/spermidine synthase [Runella salmonicolor]